jgi:hypothetical protein
VVVDGAGAKLKLLREVEARPTAKPTTDRGVPGTNLHRIPTNRAHLHESRAYI